MLAMRRHTILALRLLILLSLCIQPHSAQAAAGRPARADSAPAALAQAVEEPTPPPPAPLDYPGWEPAALTLDVPAPVGEAPPALLGEVTNDWTPVMSENFDGAFPSAGWTLNDANGDQGGEVYWGKESYLHASPGYSAWAAGAGKDGRNPAASGYPHEMAAYMIYGPFDMAGASSARLSFSYWSQTEAEDNLYVMVATDEGGTSYMGWRNTETDTGGWKSASFDLAKSPFPNVLGEPVVRVAFIFISDTKNTTSKVEKGPFIDDVLLEKRSGPDLTFTTPVGWEGPLVASAGPNTHQSSLLNTHLTTYVDWAVVNQGASTTATYTNCLFIEETPDSNTFRVVTCSHQAGLGSGKVGLVEDYELLTPESPPWGWNYLKLVIDVNNTVAETDETNNVYMKEFRWDKPAAADLRPHAPTGWSHPVVPNSAQGSTTYFLLNSGPTYFYVDWAVINQSSATVTTDFRTCLYLDGVEKKCWMVTADIPASVVYWRDDESITSPAAGQHTLRLVVDVDNTVPEANEDNNVWERKFTWYPHGSCGPFVARPPEGPIPGGGAWVSWDLGQPGAPEGALVGDVSLKLAIDHPHPEEIDVYLAHEGSPGLVQVETTGLNLAGSREVTVRVAEFSGRPAAGAWTLWLRDPQPGRGGRLVSASLSALPVLPGQPAAGGEGAPAAFRLEEGARVIELPPAGSGGEITSPPGQAGAASGWVPFLVEDFESGFVSGGHRELKDDVTQDNCQYLWGADDKERPAGGGRYAGWPAGGGEDGLDPAGSLYPPNQDSWMIFGPFDLSDTTDFKLSFDLKRDIEPVHDYLFVGASNDHLNFNGLTYSGSQDWTRINLNLSGFGGDNSVWIGFRFVSDPSNQKAGPWIDNIEAVKQGSLPEVVYLPAIWR